jgi:hypothetical protein
MVDEATLERAREDLVLVVDKHPDTLVLKQTDDTGAEVDNLLVRVGDTFFQDPLLDAPTCLFVKETE